MLFWSVALHATEPILPLGCVGVVDVEAVDARLPRSKGVSATFCFTGCLEAQDGVPFLRGYKSPPFWPAPTDLALGIPS